MEVHPNLRITPGNTSIIYISRNNLIHLHKSEDPVFSATEEVQIFPLNMTGYVPKWERRLAAVACVERLQVCTDFGGRRECSPWTGVLRGERGEMGLGNFYNQSSKEEKGLILLLFPLKPEGLTIGNLAQGLESNIVAARSLLSIPSPDGRLVELQTAQGEEQWKAEVSQCNSQNLQSRFFFPPLNVRRTDG